MHADIQQINGLPFGRAYKITRDSNSCYVPSVTTVLKLNHDPFLEKLEAELGPEKYLKIQRRGGERGTVMHRWLEIFLNHYQETKDPEFSLLETQKYIADTDEFNDMSEVKRALKIGKSLFYNFYTDEFYKNIRTVLHNEIFLYTFFRGGWAGAADFIYEDTNGNLVVQDFKSSSIMKDTSKLDNYKMQISCYMFKYAEMFGRIPDRGEIVISNESNMNLQRVYVPQSEMKIHLRKFLSLLKEFRNTTEWLDFEKSVECISGNI